MQPLRFFLTLVVAVGLLASCSSPDRAPEGGQAAAPVATGSAVPIAALSPTRTPLPPTPTSIPASTPTAAPTATPTIIPTAMPTMAPAGPLESCPVTPPPDPPFVPPAPVKTWSGNVWFGSPALWTQSTPDGVWPTGNYMAKFFWWREGYNWTTEGQPNLTVTGRRLDAPAPLATSSRATNAYNPGDIGSAMLVGFSLQTPGCWEITGRYNDVTLTFVIWVRR